MARHMRKCPKCPHEIHNGTPCEDSMCPCTEQLFAEFHYDGDMKYIQELV